MDSLSNEYQQMSLDHQRETQFNRDGQVREHQLKNELRKLQSFMVLLPAYLLLPNAPRKHHHQLQDVLQAA